MTILIIQSPFLSKMSHASGAKQEMTRNFSSHSTLRSGGDAGAPAGSEKEVTFSQPLPLW